MRATVELIGKHWQTALFSMHLLAREIRNADQEKPETGSLLDQYGLTQKPKTAPLKLETLHEYTGQLVRL
jgi:hypothetical protein